MTDSYIPEISVLAKSDTHCVTACEVSEAGLVLPSGEAQASLSKLFMQMEATFVNGAPLSPLAGVHLIGGKDYREDGKEEIALYIVPTLPPSAGPTSALEPFLGDSYCGHEHNPAQTEFIGTHFPHGHNIVVRDIDEFLLNAGNWLDEKTLTQIRNVLDLMRNEPSLMSLTPLEQANALVPVLRERNLRRVGRGAEAAP